MSKALELKLALPTGNLAAYRQAVNSVPMLSAAEEKELAEATSPPRTWTPPGSW